MARRGAALGYEHYCAVRRGAVQLEFCGVIPAGTFYTHDGRVFYDMRDPDQTIAIDLAGESYRHIIVQVNDPAAAAAQITPALSGR